MEVGSLVSRRTRSRFDAYYRNLHNTIKNPDRQTHNVKLDEEKIEESDAHQIESINVNSESEFEEEEEEKKRCAEKEVGMAANKNKNNNNKIDLVRLLEKSGGWRDKYVYDLEIERKIEDCDVDVRESENLGLKFNLEEAEKPQKSEWEKEIDSLFDDLEVGLWESRDSCNVAMSDDEYCSSRNDEDVDVDWSRAGMCGRGEHDEVVDEQIGIVCTYCRALLLDIKYVLPTFVTCVESRGEWKRRSSDSEESNDEMMIKLKPAAAAASSSSSSSSDARKGGKGTVFDLIPGSAKELYPHQLEGFEVMWRNIAGDIRIDNLDLDLDLDLESNKGGRGCIISHAPGTGKTRLTIVFLQTLLSLYPKSRPLIVAPRGMLLTWEHELNLWNAQIPFHNLNTTATRAAMIRSWITGGSILALGYRLFEQLALTNNILLHSPTLLILDEGHTPRNHHTLTWKALSNVTTRRRIILSGTPFQNNFDELYNTLSLVNPTLSQDMISALGSGTGTSSSSSSRKRRSRGPNNTAKQGWDHLTRNDQGIKKLRALLQPFVHIHKGTILNTSLPGLKDSLLILKPTHLQQKLLHHNLINTNFLEQAHLASLISIHPSLVAQQPHFKTHSAELKSLASDPKAGVKTHFLIHLIQISSTIHEKVLIFSDFIKPLLHIKKLLKSHLGYTQGREVLYIDGDLSMQLRQSLISSFNDKNGQAKVLLASQRACCEGISLVGASRVVLLDVAWNPAVERQAISRAYRLGQEKMVYVYHLVTMMEVNKYARQTEKDRISELVFSDVGQSQRDYFCTQDVSQDKVLEAMLHHQDQAMFERIVHHPKDKESSHLFGQGF